MYLLSELYELCSRLSRFVSRYVSVLSLPCVKCRALPGSGLRLKANRVQGFRGSGGKVQGERNPKLKSTYFWGSSPPIYTSSKLPSCNNNYKSKPSKNPPEYFFLSTESSGVFHNFPPNSINNLPELSGVFHPPPYYILPIVPLHHIRGDQLGAFNDPQIGTSERDTSINSKGAAETMGQWKRNGRASLKHDEMKSKMNEIKCRNL